MASKSNMAIIIVSLLVIIVGSVTMIYSPITFRNFSMLEFTKLIGKLLLIAVFLERALDVFLTTFRAQGSEEHKKAIRKIKIDMSKLTKEDGSVISAKKTEYNKLVKKLEDKKQELVTHKSKTRVIAIWSGFSVGIIISSIGIRSLSDLLNKETFAVLPVLQQKAFSLIDILLTGGVLAGGSDSIHKIFDVYTNYMSKSSSMASGIQDD
jgi:hypothetical protein